jgi:hypothetical protein
MTASGWFEGPEERLVVIKRASDFVGVILAIAIFLAVAVAGAVMIAVPVPILLHFLSQYGGVTGTAGDDDLPPCRCGSARLSTVGGIRPLARFR